MQPNRVEIGPKFRRYRLLHSKIRKIRHFFGQFENFYFESFRRRSILRNITIKKNIKKYHVLINA